MCILRSRKRRRTGIARNKHSCSYLEACSLRLGLYNQSHLTSLLSCCQLPFSCHPVFTMGNLAWGISPLLIISRVLLSSAAPNCPLIGPEFPPPQHLSDHPIWKQAIQNITNVFDYIDISNITGIDRFSYSLQIFSANPGLPILWERHRTAKNLPSNTTGVKKVDGDTVYRLGSVTKVFTVLTWLAELGDVHWNQPITKYIPELTQFPGDSTASGFDSVKNTAWEDITIGSLASQVSGLGRDCEPHLTFKITSQRSSC